MGKLLTGMVLVLFCAGCGSDDFSTASAPADSGADAADMDGDGFLPPLDCNDEEPLAHPSVDGANVTPQTERMANGSWDYDCDGDVEMAYPFLASCGAPGWKNIVPDCGNSAERWMGWSDDGTTCGEHHTLEVVQQGCF